MPMRHWGCAFAILFDDGLEPDWETRKRSRHNLARVLVARLAVAPVRVKQALLLVAVPTRWLRQPRRGRRRPPPYSYFNEGMAALRQKRFEAARALFEKEVERAP